MAITGGTATAEPSDRAEPLNKGLKVGALGLLSVVVIGVASTAPGYSLAASLGFVTADAGAQTPAVFLVAFVPMLFIAASYYYLNRADPDCGTTFTWATRAIGPRTGWMGGWGILIADLVIMPSLAQITGKYTFLLFGADDLANDTFWVTVLGVAFIALMTIVCVIGIELNARSQFVLLAMEFTVLVVFSVVALYQVFVNDAPGTVKPQLSWLNPLDISSFGALSLGLLTAVFLYWGWDTAVTVNEETRDSKRTPGRAAVISTFVLVGIYLLTAIAAQSVRGPGFLVKNENDVLSAAGNVVLGSGVNKFLIIAVLTSAAASTQTTILPAARSALSMAVHKAAPAHFGEINKRFLSPANATIWFGVLSIVWYIGLTLISENVLGDSILAVGLMIAFYYGLTGYACVIYYRKFIFKSFKNFIFVGVAPFVGATMLAAILVKACIEFAKPDYGSGESLFGLGYPFVIGVGLMALGIPLMIAWWIKAPAFFRRGRDPHPHPAPDGTGAKVPLILDAGPILDADLDAVATGSGNEGDSDKPITWTPGGSDGK